MIGPFSRYLKTIENDLPSEHRKLLRGDLYLTILDWYTEGIAPEEAASRIKHALGLS